MATGGRAQLQRAVIDSGFEYQRELRGAGLPGMLFRAGAKVVASDVIDARSSAAPFVAGGLTALYGEDSSLPSMAVTSFVAIPLERTVPNILLFGKGIGALRRAGVSIAGRQKLSLEGDFDRHFTLYCPEGYERDALEIFTPDLMQLLMDTTKGCDVELVDDWMFVYSGPGRYSKADALPGLVAVTERARDKVHRQTSRYRDERSERVSGTVSPAEHAARAGRVAEGGARLKTRTSLPRVLVTIGSTALLLVALTRFLFPDLLPWLP